MILHNSAVSTGSVNLKLVKNIHLKLLWIAFNVHYIALRNFAERFKSLFEY